MTGFGNETDSLTSQSHAPLRARSALPPSSGENGPPHKVARVSGGGGRPKPWSEAYGTHSAKDKACGGSQNHTNDWKDRQRP